MKVKDVVLAAASMLGMYEGVNDYFENGDVTLKREGDLLLECFNRVENSLALEYLPLHAEDTMLTVQDKLNYSMLTYAPVRILSVENGAGEALKFKVYPTYLEAPAGKLKIMYTYTPDKKQIGEDSDFTLLTSESLFVHGILAEYCLSEGRLSEAAAWEKKYKAEIEAAFYGQTGKRISSRRWI